MLKGLSKSEIEEIQQLNYYVYHEGIVKPERWEPAQVPYDDRTGLHVEAFKKGNKIVIAYRGTSVEEINAGDIRNVVSYYNNKIPSQLKNAEAFYSKIERAYGAEYEIIVSGYSLGGLLAQIIGYKNKRLTYTYGAIGAGDYFGEVPVDVDFIHNYGRSTDVFFLSKFDKHIGKIYINDAKVPADFRLYKIGNHFPPFSKSTENAVEYTGDRKIPMTSDKFEGAFVIKAAGLSQSISRPVKDGADYISDITKKRIDITGTAIRDTRGKVVERVNDGKREVVDFRNKGVKAVESAKGLAQREIAKYPREIFESGVGGYWGIDLKGEYQSYKALPAEVMDRVVKIGERKVQAGAKMPATTVKKAVLAILEKPGLVKGMTKENAKKLVLAVGEQFSGDKELVENFKSLVKDAVGIESARASTAQKLQSRLGKEFARKAQKEVLVKAGFSEAYVEKLVKGGKALSALKSAPVSELEKAAESLRPALKAKRLIGESMARSEEKKVDKTATETDRWFDRVLSEMPDPTRDRVQSINFEDIKVEKESKEGAKAQNSGKGDFDAKTGLMLLSMILGAVFGGEEVHAGEKVADAAKSVFKPAALAKGYENAVTKSGQIFTREDIDSMSKGERKKNKAAIEYQSSSIGIPTKSEAKKEVSGGGMVHVSGYTRDDGVVVKSYYCARPRG